MARRFLLLAILFAFPASGTWHCREYLGAVALLDPLGSGRAMGPIVKQSGRKTIAVLGDTVLPSGYSFDKNEWDDVLVFKSGEETARELIEHRFGTVAVIDCSDSGTVKGCEIRDAARAQGVRFLGSTMELAWARRDKKELALALGPERTSKQFAVTTLADALLAADAVGYPVFVKPNRNAGGTGGKICSTPDEVEKIFNAVDLTGGPNNMRVSDTAVIVMEVMKDPEIAVNAAIDTDGNFVFTGVWLYGRLERDGRRLYRYDRLLDPSKVDLRTVFDEAEQDIRSLKHVGVMHAESFNRPPTPEEIEKQMIRELRAGRFHDFGARLSGGGLRVAEFKITYNNPFEMALDIAVQPDALAGRPKIYTVYHPTGAVFILSDGKATASRRLEPKFEQLKQRKTGARLIDYTFFYEEGDGLVRTVDSDGVVFKALIQADTDEERDALAEEILKLGDAGQFENRP